MDDTEDGALGSGHGFGGRTSELEERKPSVRRVGCVGRAVGERGGVHTRPTGAVAECADMVILAGRVRGGLGVAVTYLLAD